MREIGVGSGVHYSTVYSVVQVYMSCGTCSIRYTHYTAAHFYYTCVHDSCLRVQITCVCGVCTVVFLKLPGYK